MPRSRIRIAVPPDFSFASTVRSHGWSALPPFEADPARSSLGVAFTLPGGEAVRVSVREAGGGLEAAVDAFRAPGPAGRRAVLATVRSCFRMDEDLAAFHRLMRRQPEHRWIAQQRAGRMLRSPSAFEDAVKMICTTNCTWELTTLMVTSLVGLYGAPAPGGARTFPAPEALAAAGEGALRREARTGYRAPYIAAFAEAVAAGRVEPEGWRTWRGDTASLFRSMCAVKGIGPYAAGNLLKLAGRYEHLGLDTWVRGQYARLHHGGRRVSDRTIERAYASYGDWRGLVFWLAMTREWYGAKFRARRPS